MRQKGVEVPLCPMCAGLLKKWNNGHSHHHVLRYMWMLYLRFKVPNLIIDIIVHEAINNLRMKVSRNPLESIKTCIQSSKELVELEITS